jgi:hypothetical protein
MTDNNIPSTFIPHDTAVAPSRIPQIVQSAGFSDLLLVISIVLVVASGALAGGVFLYQQYLTTASASKLAQLQRAQAAFEPTLIQELTRLDDRMIMAQSILDNHIAPSAFFTALSQSTLQTVSFSGLGFDTSDPKHISIKMGGVGQSLNSVALQAQVFSKSGIIKDPIFSGINRQLDGVHFNFAADIDASSVNYAHIINTIAAGTVSAQASQIPMSQPAASSTGTSAFGTPPSASGPSAPVSGVPSSTKATH